MTTAKVDIERRLGLFREVPRKLNIVGLLRELKIRGP